MSSRTGSFSLVSAAGGGGISPIRLVALCAPFNDDLETGGGFQIYADDGRGGAGSDWTIYPGVTGVPMTTPRLVEWAMPSGSTLLAATSRAVDDPSGFNGQVVLFGPAPGDRAVGTHTDRWLGVGSPTTGHADDTWLTESSPALVTGSYGPHGSLELCLATRSGGFRHLYADATDPGHLTAAGSATAWATSGMFATEHHFDGVAVAEDAFSNQLVLVGVAGTEVIVLVRDSRLAWGAAVSVWTSPASITLVGVPALWQEQLPPSFTPAGPTRSPGDFLIAVGLSDGSAQLLRLPYRLLNAPEVSAAADVLPALLWPSLTQLASGSPVPAGNEVLDIDALALAQAPASTDLLSSLEAAALELYCSYGAGEANASRFVLDGTTWGAPQYIPSGVAPYIPPH